MRSIIATQKSRRSTNKPTGVLKLAGSDPKKPDRALRSLDKYFWYISSDDGVDRLATSSSTLSEVPVQVNDYIFHPSNFAQYRYPGTFPKGVAWPPQRIQDFLLPIGEEGKDCVGGRCYTNLICKDLQCRHTFDGWKLATNDWQTHFELRKTENRGIGVYTKRAFKKGDVLGWYAGELIKYDRCEYNNDYLMELNIGNVLDSPTASESDSGRTNAQLRTPPPSSNPLTVSDPEPIVVIDASRSGNWTRFINHSCAPHCEFRLRRVGNIRIMVIEAARTIPANVELTVQYGEDYYGPNSYKLCYCDACKCVGRPRRKRQEGGFSGREKKKVKKCRRLTPPDE